jgi:hypothetical protein
MLIPIEMNLADRDLCIIQIENQIEAKKNMLLNKQKLLNKNLKYNSLLQNLRDDYTQYYNYIIEQKRQQMIAMETLNQYLYDLTISGNLSDNNIKDAKREQKIIMNEIKNIKITLDDLIKKTDTPPNLENQNITNNNNEI